MVLAVLVKVLRLGWCYHCSNIDGGSCGASNSCNDTDDIALTAIAKKKHTGMPADGLKTAAP